MPHLALHDTLSYALKLWSRAENALLDGGSELDSNCAERAIKLFMIGRRTGRPSTRRASPRPQLPST